MGDSYDAREIFDMAVEIERRGADYYRKAAEHAGSSEIKDFMLELAKMEEKHLQTFTAMKQEYMGENGHMEVVDPDDEMSKYLGQIASAHGWEGKASPVKEFTGKETLQEILTTAIAAEKDSINFYVGLKESVNAQKGRDEVDEIIREEMSHVAKLNDYLSGINK